MGEIIKQYHPYKSKPLTDYCDRRIKESENSFYHPVKTSTYDHGKPPNTPGIHFTKQVIAQMTVYAFPEGFSDLPKGFSPPDTVMADDRSCLPMYKRMKTLIELVRSHQP